MKLTDLPWPLHTADGRALATPESVAHHAADALADADDGVTLLLFDRPPADGEALRPCLAVALVRHEDAAEKPGMRRAG